MSTGKLVEFSCSNCGRMFLLSDCRKGQSLVVHAINEGRQAAREIDIDLSSGKSLLPGPGGVIPYASELLVGS